MFRDYHLQASKVSKSGSNHDINLKSVAVAFALAGFWINQVFFYGNDPFKTACQLHTTDDEVITAGIWTIHFGLDNNMWASERKCQPYYCRYGIDVVGLLETVFKEHLWEQRFN